MSTTTASRVAEALLPVSWALRSSSSRLPRYGDTVNRCPCQASRTSAACCRCGRPAPSGRRACWSGRAARRTRRAGRRPDSTCHGTTSTVVATLVGPSRGSQLIADTALVGRSGSLLGGRGSCSVARVSASWAVWPVQMEHHAPSLPTPSMPAQRRVARARTTPHPVDGRRVCRFLRQPRRGGARPGEDGRGCSTRGRSGPGRARSRRTARASSRPRPHRRDR